MLVLFDDQSKNLQAITPLEVEFRLLRPGPPPKVAFASHVTDLLDYLASEVRVVAPPPRLERVCREDCGSVQPLTRLRR
jgi:hypothetical protein